MKFKRIMADNVLLKAREAKETTASGIILATTNKEKPMIYEVVMAGPEAEGLKTGDLVVVGKFTGTTAVRGSLEEAIAAAYRLSAGVKFANAFSRSDIGQRALQAKK